MKHKFFVLTLISLFAVVLAGCTTGTNVVINCSGFSISGSAFNPSGQTFTLYVVAEDSAGNEIFDGPAGSIGSDPSEPISFSASGTWSQTPATGTITLLMNGDPFTGKCDPNAAQGSLPVFTDGRINPDTGASVVGYCSNGAIKVWAKVNDKWTLVGTVSKKAILEGLEKAVNTGQHVLLFEKSGQQVWALSSNELQFHNAMGTPAYDFVFPGNRCS